MILIVVVGLWIGFWVIADSAIYKAGLTEMCSTRIRTTMLGVQSAFGYSMTIIAPVVFGKVLQAYNPGANPTEAVHWGPAFLVLGVGALGAPLAIWVLRRHRQAQLTPVKKMRGTEHMFQRLALYHEPGLGGAGPPSASLPGLYPGLETMPAQTRTLPSTAFDTARGRYDVHYLLDKVMTVAPGCDLALRLVHEDIGDFWLPWVLAARGAQQGRSLILVKLGACGGRCQGGLP